MTLLGAILVSGAVGPPRVGATRPAGAPGRRCPAVSFAGYLLSAERAGSTGSPPVTTLLIGFVVAVAIWVALPPWNWPIELLADPRVAWRVIAVGLVGTLLPFALVVGALRWISSAVAGIATTAEPVLAAALAWLFLGQELSLPQLIGGGLVIAAVLITQTNAEAAGAGGHGRRVDAVTTDRPRGARLASVRAQEVNRWRPPIAPPGQHRADGGQGAPQCRRRPASKPVGRRRATP